MRQLIITQWVSLDGVFDAGSMDTWWNPFDSPERQRYIQDTINHCDVMVYGRITYEMLFPYWSSFQDNEMGVADKLNKGRKYVVSSGLTRADWENTTIIGGDFTHEVAALKKEDGGYILVQGSSTLLKPLLEEGLVDELRLLVNPAIMGTGKRAFSKEIDCRLSVADVRRLDKNVVLLIYKPI